jgi:propanediol dehydratase small subunit
MTYSKSDYPLAEKHAEKIRGARGKSLSDVTLDAVISGNATIEDLRITPQALLNQAEISRSAGRPRLADNFARAAELVNVPQEQIMQTYELLRPGRAKDKAQLLQAAANLRKTYGAGLIADFIEEAAAVYEQRGLFSKRF